MSSARLERLTWVLIYGGLLLLCLGFFLRRADSVLGIPAMAGGGLLAAVGVLLVWVRSRRPR